MNKASKITEMITKAFGLASTKNQKNHNRNCDCGCVVPSYTGRYPKSCPKCGNELVPKTDSHGNIKNV